jgi:predicted TPR repeat methyltransferase
MVTEPASDALLSEAHAAYCAQRITEADTLCRRALRNRPVHPGALRLLGKLHYLRGDHAEAVRLLTQSIGYSPHVLDAHSELAAACRALGLPTTAIRHLKRIIALQPNHFGAYSQLAALYYELGCVGKAAGLYRRWASKDPNNAEVLHMLAATTGHEVPDRCSSAFIRTHFDKLARTFDRHLVEDLNYTGHEIVVAALARCLLAGTAKVNVLDAGCGTGLCGPLLRRYCCRLTGVDLSEQMIEHARRREVYDVLVPEELCAFMHSRPREFDAIVSSDVFIYIGGLARPFRSANRALKPGGLFIVTIEALLGSAEEPYRLQVHGRYCHRTGYIQSTLSDAGFEVISIAQKPVRKELGKDVIGLLAIARKRYDDAA